MICLLVSGLDLLLATGLGRDLLAPEVAARMRLDWLLTSAVAFALGGFVLVRGRPGAVGEADQSGATPRR